MPAYDSFSPSIVESGVTLITIAPNRMAEMRQ
jgi:hypothetical protein